MAEQTHAYKTLDAERSKLQGVLASSAVQLASLQRQANELAEQMDEQAATIVELSEVMASIFIEDPEPEGETTDPLDEGWVDDPQNPHAESL